MLKGGEEVRTDQRVEQLFAVMNGLMARSPAAAAAKLQVRPAATAPFQAPRWYVTFRHARLLISCFRIVCGSSCGRLHPGSLVTKLPLWLV